MSEYASTPISGMSLMQAKRSFLIQVQQLEQFKWSKVGQVKIEDLSDSEASKLYNELYVMANNLRMTAEHVERLEADGQ